MHRHLLFFPVAAALALGISFSAYGLDVEFADDATPRNEEPEDNATEEFSPYISLDELQNLTPTEILAEADKPIQTDSGADHAEIGTVAEPDLEIASRKLAGRAENEMSDHERDAARYIWEDQLFKKAFILESYNGEPVESPRPITLLFDDEGGVVGRICNTFSGTGDYANMFLKVTDAATTRMMCPDEKLAKLENEFLRNIAMGVSFQISDDELELRRDSMVLIYRIDDDPMKSNSSAPAPKQTPAESTTKPAAVPEPAPAPKAAPIAPAPVAPKPAAPPAPAPKQTAAPVVPPASVMAPSAPAAVTTPAPVAPRAPVVPPAPAAATPPAPAVVTPPAASLAPPPVSSVTPPSAASLAPPAAITPPAPAPATQPIRPAAPAVRPADAGSDSDGSFDSPVSEGELVGRMFVLAKVDGKDFSPDMGEQPFVQFDQGLMMTGKACNNFRGKGKLEGKVLTMMHAASTMMMCVDAKLNQYETDFHRLLGEGVEVDVDGKRLILSGGGREFMYLEP